MTSPRKSVLITGTSSGSIGSALALAFAKQNLLVFATARDVAKIPPSLSSLPNVEIVPLDVTSSDLIRDAVEDVRAKTGGRLDYLINNAGSGYTIPLAEVDIEAGKKVFDVNFWGVLSVTQAFIPLLVRSKGTVVNISSVGAVIHTPWIGIYSASKAALSIASETLRLELAPFGVNVITTMVGSISDTKFHANNASYHLPSDSMYHPVEKYIADTDSGKLNPEGSNVDAFAADLASDILRGTRGQIWKGKLASMCKFMSTWVPWRLLDGMASHMRGIDVLTRSVQGGKG